MKKASMNKFITGKLQEKFDEVHTCRICEILEVDMNLYKADVLPLDDPDATPILDVPIGYFQTESFVIQMPYKPGDKVYVVFAEKDTNPILFDGGEAATGQFNENDGVIVGGVNIFTKPLTNPHPDDVLISDKEFKYKIRIQEDGQIFMESEENITIESKKDVIIQGNVFRREVI